MEVSDLFIAIIGAVVGAAPGVVYGLRSDRRMRDREQSAAEKRIFLDFLQASRRMVNLNARNAQAAAELELISEESEEFSARTTAFENRLIRWKEQIAALKAAVQSAQANSESLETANALQEAVERENEQLAAERDALEAMRLRQEQKAESLLQFADVREAFRAEESTYRGIIDQIRLLPGDSKHVQGMTEVFGLVVSAANNFVQDPTKDNRDLYDQIEDTYLDVLRRIQ